jgi:hypothetical protein
MAKSGLSADEQALWNKVIESVEPLDRSPMADGAKPSSKSAASSRSDLSRYAVPKLPERKSGWIMRLPKRLPHMRASSC